MWRKSIGACLIAVSLSGCATRAAISDIGEDKVKVIASGNDQSVILAEANRGCSNYNRYAVQMSWRCLDGYCIQEEYLFVCKKSS